jgi:hypothetical protein
VWLHYSDSLPKGKEGRVKRINLQRGYMDHSKIGNEDIALLKQLKTIDHLGQHFTSIYSNMWLIFMESNGYIRIERPCISNQTGDDAKSRLEDWEVQLTGKALALIGP